MIATSKIPNPLLEIGILSDVDLPVASCASGLDEDSLEGGPAWLCGSIGFHPLLVPSSIP